MIKKLFTEKMNLNQSSENILSCNLPGTPQQESQFYYYPDKDKIEELIINIYSNTEEENEKLEEQEKRDKV